MKIWTLTAAATTLMLGGCFNRMNEIGREPGLTPVGAGLVPAHTAIGTMPATPASYVTRASLWQDNGADLFKDPRATKVGDVITVKISIKDKASIDNNNSRSRSSTRELDITNKANLSWSGLNKHLDTQSSGELDPKVESTTSTDAKGGISRAESINLLIGAVVTEVLPNGNLIVAGRQEVRVNFELRELLISGIIRPRDIATDNSISYDKIAEARISYGGRGRIMDVAQPAWGQQVTDWLLPF
jgi:flagellar L-ring protein precursor FlgH